MRGDEKVGQHELWPSCDHKPAGPAALPSVRAWVPVASIGTVLTLCFPHVAILGTAGYGE